MGFLTGGLSYIVPFLVILTVLVFVHELGHYLVARWNKVRVEVFSIGFGKELFGWTDRAGTRWKVGILPLGGYVRMYGEGGMIEGPSETDTKPPATEEDRAASFQNKRLYQRAAVVSAGPIANFIFAIVLLAVIFMTVGQAFTPPEVGAIEANSAAAAAGIQAHDTIVSVDGRRIERFEALQQIVQLNTGTPMSVVVKRGDQELTLTATPHMITETDRFGVSHQLPRLGVSRSHVDYVRHDPLSAIYYAADETWNLTAGTLRAVGQMITGRRSSDELSGPVGIVRMSGEVAEGGVVSILWFMAVLSVNLGLINLFPIPVLDGGHLLFYFAEAIRGKPLGHRAQEYGFRVGLALVLTLMVFATWNDLARLRIIEFLKGLVT